MEPYAKGVAIADFDPRADVERLEAWLRLPHVARWWGNPALYLATLARRSPGTHALILADGAPVGYLCWQIPSRGELEAAGLTDLPEDLVDIDIMIGEPELLYRGIGPKALALLLARLQNDGVSIAGLGTSLENRAASRAFEKAGFRLLREFEDPEAGPCRYMVAELHDAL
jgi:RimJ/RimL family protein N-acetyltransferase